MRLRAAVPAFALAAVVALLYLRPLAFGETFCLRDHLTLNIPSRAAVAHALAAGHLPEWWDRIGLGVPLAADPLAEVAYPPTWLLRWLSPAVGTDLLAIGHVLWFGLGLVLLARRLGASRETALVGAAALCASGYAVSMIVNVLALTMAWMPWLAWACDRLAQAPAGARRSAGALVAVVFGFEIIAGDPASVITSVIVATALVLARAEPRAASLGRMALALACGAAISAVALLPALALLRTSERASGITLADAQVWSMHPLRMLEWIWPHALGDPLQPTRDLARLHADTGGGSLDPRWTLSLFVGAPVLLLAGFAAAQERWLRWLGVASLVLVLLALGRYTPLYAVWRFLAPPERLIRYPEKHFAGALVLWCALAAVGLERALAEQRRRLAMIALGIGALLLAVSGILALARPALGARPGFDAGGARSVVLTGGVMAGAATALFGVALLLQRHRRAAFGLAAASIFAPLLAHAWELQPLIPRAVLAHPPALVAAASPSALPARLYRPRELPVSAAGATPSDRALAMRETAAENTAAPYGFAHMPGYLTTHASRFHAFWDQAAGHGARILQLFDVEWAILPARTHLAWSPIAATPDGALVLGRVAGRRPRAFVTTRWRWQISDEAATAALFASSDEIQLAGAGPAPTNPASITPCSVATDRPEGVELGCNSTSGGYAVLLDAWAPGWSATVDGADAPIVRADVVARAVAVPPGAHTVVFRYRTPGLRAGALISLCALALAVMALRRRSAP